MVSTTAIRSKQLFFLLVISRITFSYSYISAISPGNNVQDILLAVPVVFGIDLIIFAPALMLLNRHPGRDLVDCAWQITGTGLGSIIGFFYYLYFTAICVSSIILFQQFYVSTISSEISGLIISVPMLIVAVYGAIKGIESISRFGLFVFVIYLLVSLVMYLSVLPDIKLDYLRPLLYNGPRVFLLSVLAGVSSSFQILMLAMCTPFLQKKTSIVKIIIYWDIAAALLYFLMHFFVVTSMGPFAGKQIFPLQTLASLSHISPFDRLDSALVIAWIVDTALTVACYLLFASQCLLKTRLHKWRRSLIMATALIVLICCNIISNFFIKRTDLFISPVVLFIDLCAVLFIPLFLLVIDVIKGKVAKADENADEKIV